MESVLEYHRIVQDLFPVGGEKLVRLAVSDFIGRFLTTKWGERLLSYGELLAELSSCDVPAEGGDSSSCSILNGLSIAVEAISETTPFQRSTVSTLLQHPPTVDSSSSREMARQLLDHVQHSGGGKQGDDVEYVWRRWGLRNRGTVVVLTSMEDPEKEFGEVVDHVKEQIQARNDSIQTVEGHAGLYFIDRLDLYVVNFNPCPPPSAGWQSSTSSHLRSTLINLPVVETHLIPNIHRVLHTIYSLASTTVSGIPMREDTGSQQSGGSQSVNYDVELFHPKQAHADLGTLNFLSEQYRVLDECAHGVYKTVRLKWCTAKMKSADKFPLLLGSFPLTPAFVNSR